jgi:predicted  nucleic acid-binding Zn-ribbon protein
MSAVTKTLVILVFALSIVFASMQVVLFGKRANYGDLYVKTAEQLNTARGDLDKTKKELSDAQVALDKEKARLEADNQRLANDKAAADAEVQKLQLLTGQMNTTIQGRDARVTALEGDIATRDASIKELKTTVDQRDAAIKEHLGTITDLDKTVADRNASIGQLQHDLTETKKKLVATSASEEQLLATISELVARGVAVPPIALPIVNGRVVRVDNEYHVAVVDKGKDDGVKPNTTFTIYDGNEYIARLIIQDVQPKSSVGLIKLMAGRDVKEGDKATTEIP